MNEVAMVLGNIALFAIPIGGMVMLIVGRLGKMVGLGLAGLILMTAGVGLWAIAAFIASTLDVNLHPVGVMLTIGFFIGAITISFWVGRLTS